MAGVETEYFFKPVSDKMFGANVLFHRDGIVDGTFDEVAEKANVTAVRYPGGTVSEKYFDLRNPDKATTIDPATGKTVELLPLSEFMNWAGGAGLGVNIVIPTSFLAVGQVGSQRPHSDTYSIVYDFVTQLLDGKWGTARIDGLEIGNEYWLGAEQNHTEYARIADIVARAAQDAIDVHAATAGPGWAEPDIGIQVGQTGRFAPDPGWQQNDYIMDSLSDAAARAIDSVIVHYYTRGTFEDLPSFEYYFDRLNTWTKDPRYAGIEYHVTEWNTDHLLSKETGLKQASTIVWMMSEMISEDVTSAFVWPLQQNTPNDLAGVAGSEDLTIAGETFRLMSDLLDGSTLVSRTTYDDGMTYVYATDDGFVVAASALGLGALTLDLSQWGSVQSAIVYEIDATGDRLGPGAISDIGTYDLLSSTLRLADYQTVFVEVRGALNFHRPVAASTRLLSDAADHHVVSSSSETDFILGGSGSDTLVGGAGADRFDGGAGADAITGNDGNDWLLGGRDDDRLYGNAGADILSGDDGKDLLDGGIGNDTMSGGAWDDTLLGWAGRDVLYGDGGRDLLKGQEDDDRMFGGDWHDTLIGGSGDDLLHGGRGDDSLLGEWGDDLIYADEGADTIDGGSGADTIYGSLQANVIAGGTGHDLIFADETGSAYLDYLVW
ncbi:calcium-binding protein [Palleronia sp.]|uniref:calcium-binding protein n=1 Tax=Palleronia sp. TaxID=1940284 RepID=UPI0035C81505